MISSSAAETIKHIRAVQGLLSIVLRDLTARAFAHDASKLESPEVEIFEEWTPKLRAMTYGSDEYDRARLAMGVALEHHYANNRHHPEHFPGGIDDMNLVDVLEMLCDWLAATRRHADGDIRRSIEHNAGRFGYGEQIKRLLYNTLPLLEGDAC